MKKQEFLNKLDKCLAKISKEERLDLLNEYSLNIDDKMANGMSEEEAVSGFGNPQALANDLLETFKSEKFFFFKSLKNQFNYYVDSIETPSQFSSNNFMDKLLATLIKTTKVCFKLLAKFIYWVLLVSVIITLIVIAGVCGVSLILMFDGYPLSGIVTSLVGASILIGGIYLALSKKKLSKYVLITSFVGALIGGAGISITFIEFTELKPVAYINNIAETSTVSHFLIEGDTLNIENYAGVDIDVVHDDTLTVNEVKVINNYSNSFTQFVNLYNVNSLSISGYTTSRADIDFIKFSLNELKKGNLVYDTYNYPIELVVNTNLKVDIY